MVEYINQTRGWFYTLHVLAGALFDKPAFKNVICHGILLAEDGTNSEKTPGITRSQLKFLNNKVLMLCVGALCPRLLCEEEIRDQ